ncbi:MAG TPA: protease inhibitor I9 family protein [Nitrososphaeraceae archaeon]|jgi:hypothetical protein
MVFAIIFIFSYLEVNLPSSYTIAANVPVMIDSLQANSSKVGKNDLQLDNHYIVTMKGNATSLEIGHVISQVKEKGGQVLQVYEHAIKGFSMSLPAISANNTIVAIKANPEVISVEKDAEVNIAKSQT